MNTAPFTIESMLPRYNQAVSWLLLCGFGGKFLSLSKLSDDRLALFFEKLLLHYPEDTAGQRVVAIQNGEVIGTLSLKWSQEFSLDKQARHRPSWQDFSDFSMLGKWSLLKLLLGLHYLGYQPKGRECYIADVSVHPQHRGKGVGTQLLLWAQRHMATQSFSDYLSLHVSANNQRAKQLYEQLSFRTCSQDNSIMRYFLFKEYEWNYMILR